MNKAKILNLVSDKVDNTLQENELLEAIEEAVFQIKSAREFFESVSDPNLVDCAIYMEEAAKARYSFLLDEAKKLKVRTKHNNILIESKAI